MLSDLAEKIRCAYTEGSIDPVRDVVSSQKMAYEVQDLNTSYWLTQGRQLVGRKIGLTAQVVQQQLGVDEPDFGMLFDDMEIANKGSVNLGDLIQPKVEAELAFILGADLTKNSDTLNIPDIMDATEYMVPAIEIVDSRIQGWDINICDTIADNASSALFVLGEKPVSLAGLDLSAVSMQMFGNGELVSEGRGEDCLGSPLNSMLWLARKMIDVGRPLRAGDIVLSGAFGKMVPVTSRCEFRAEFKGIGSVGVDFV